MNVVVLSHIVHIVVVVVSTHIFVSVVILIASSRRQVDLVVGILSLSTFKSPFHAL